MRLRLLFHWGDVQAKSKAAGGGAFEGVPDVAATAKYVHYALNAPVGVLEDQREMRWSPSTYWKGHDLRYFVGVIVLWYLIGLGWTRDLEQMGMTGPLHTSSDSSTLSQVTSSSFTAASFATRWSGNGVGLP
jgi:hypothetical protein